MLLLLLVMLLRVCVEGCAKAGCNLCVDCSQQADGSRDIQPAAVAAQQLLVSLMQPAAGQQQAQVQ
jgi:hypothetical protein